MKPSVGLLPPVQPKDHPNPQNIGLWEPKIANVEKSSERWYLPPKSPGLTVP